MTALRKLLLGETRVLPAAVAALVVAALVLRAVAPQLWDAAGGLLLVAGAVLALSLALPRRQPDGPSEPAGSARP